MVTGPVQGPKPHSEESLNLMRGCRHLEILSNSEQGASHHFHFVLDPQIMYLVLVDLSAYCRLLCTYLRTS